MAELLYQIWLFIQGIYNQIRDFIQGLFQGIGEFVTGIWSMLRDALLSTFEYLRDMLASVYQTIQEFFSSMIESLWSWITGIVDRIAEIANEVVYKIGAYVEQLINWVGNLVDEALGYISSFVEWISEKIGNLVNAIVEQIGAFISTVVQSVQNAIQPILAWVQQWVQQAIQHIQAAYAALVSGPQAVLNTLIAKLQAVQVGFESAATTLVQGITETATEQLQPIRDAIREFVETFLPADDPQMLADYTKAMEGVHTDPTSMENFRQWYANNWRWFASKSNTFTYFFASVMSVVALATSVGKISNVLSEMSVQEFNVQYPHAIFSPGEAAAAWRHGRISYEEAITHVRRAGYTDTLARALITTSKAYPGVPELFALWNRRELPDNDLNEALRAHGFETPWDSRLKKLAHPIPPIQDLITMGVRDVWNPAAVAIGKLFEGLPDEFVQHAGKHGVTPEWAKLYWGAHWSIPSPHQGFEMLHRGEIGPEELDTLLTALDIAPGWRKHLTAIAYHPFTRVDIRRMHALGVLDEDEVLTAYKEIGYNEEKAAKLRDFTIALNSAKVKDPDEELGRLSRSAILGFYGDGLLTRERAADLLQGIGLTMEASDLFLAAVDLDQEREERRATADLIIEQAKSGQLSPAQAADKLRAAGLETVEVDRAIIKLTRVLEAKTHIPTRAEGEKMMKLGVITPDDYRALLRLHGYADRWVEAYIATAFAKEA